jgi:hypothetical protein
MLGLYPEERKGGSADTFMTVWDSKPADQQLRGLSSEEIASLRAAVS